MAMSRAAYGMPVPSVIVIFLLFAALFVLILVVQEVVRSIVLVLFVKIGVRPSVIVITRELRLAGRRESHTCSAYLGVCSLRRRGDRAINADSHWCSPVRVQLESK